MQNEQIELLDPPEKVNTFEMVARKINSNESLDREAEILSIRVKPVMDFNLTFHKIDDSSLTPEQLSNKLYRAMSLAFLAFDEVMQKEMGI